MSRHNLSHILSRVDENEVHSCSGFFDGKHPQASACFLAQQFIGKLHDQPFYHPSDMRKDVERDLHIDISYKRIWQAKEHANAIINETNQESFQLLPHYYQQINEQNPNNTTLMKRIQDHKFRRLFIAYDASGNGFAFCRLILGLDDTHLKTK